MNFRPVPARVHVSLFAIVAILIATMGPGVSAEVRTLEAVGTVPIHPTKASSSIPRDMAVDQALREAVTRVAQDFMADRPLPGLPDEEVDAALREQDGGAAGGGEGAVTGGLDESPQDLLEELPDLDKVLGKKMVPYTTRFQVIEDRGRIPALFAEDPAVTEEYVVIVEVQVDVDRVRTRLVDAGLIAASDGGEGANQVEFEVEGLTEYPAYLAMRELLETELGATRVVPVAMGFGHTILDVETTFSAVEFLEQLLLSAPQNFAIVPVRASGGRVRVVVRWSPPIDAVGADAPAGR
ncbi:MAG: hypothetical protein ACI9QQ_002575 [Myxococcota bacterium]